MAKMCIVRHAYYPQETHVRRNAETLVERGHQVTLVCLRDIDQAPREVISGVDIYRLPIRHYRLGVARYLFEYTSSFVLAFLLVGWLHLHEHFDTVEVDSMPDFLVFCSLIPRLTSSRIVLYLFETMPEYFALKYQLLPKNWRVRLLEFVEQQATRYADHVFTVDQAFREVIVARGTPREKISVILNVPNDNIFQAARDAYHPQELLQGFTLITHGTLLDLYGIQFIIRAISRLKDRIPGLRLIIAGEGEYGSELKQLTRDLNISDMVFFTGWIPQLEVIQLILGSDAGVVATFGPYGEMCVPNKLFEYIALGKLVICSSLRAIRDYFPDDALLYFPPGDDEALANCIFRIYQQHDLSKQMVQQANLVYKQNRWEVSKKIYLNGIEGNISPIPRME